MRKMIGCNACDRECHVVGLAPMLKSNASWSKMIASSLIDLKSWWSATMIGDPGILRTWSDEQVLATVKIHCFWFGHSGRRRCGNDRRKSSNNDKNKIPRQEKKGAIQGSYHTLHLYEGKSDFTCWVSLFSRDFVALCRFVGTFNKSAPKKQTVQI